jgi:Flp pilus assembly protein protease CpaA
MLFVIIPLSVVILGLIVYFALSPRSSRTLRLAALCALGAITLSVLICALLVFAKSGTGGGETPDFLSAEPPRTAPPGNFTALFLLALFLLGFLGIVVFLARKERRDRKGQAPGGPYSS